MSWRHALRLVRDRPKPPISARAPRIAAPHRTAAGDRVLYNQLANALAAAAASHARGRLVDLGCGSKPWAPVFRPYVTEHVGVDTAEAAAAHPGSVDVVGDGHAVPLESESADTVLLTEVIMYYDDPRRGLSEAHRLLRPGGSVIVTVPQIFPRDGEHDGFRFTAHGLAAVLREAGFVEIGVHPLSGQWTTLASLRALALYPYRRGRALTALVDAYSALTLSLAVRLDEADFRGAFSWNHIATGRRAAV